MRNLSIDSAIKRVAERVTDRTRNDRQSQQQRRNSFVDMFGYEFTRQGDAQTPAQFYVSVSGDMLYLERFQFKLIFSPFAMSVGNNGATGSTSVQINDTSLSTNGTTITPNPHSHTSPAHNHSLSPGITLFSSNVENVTVSIDGIDITSYLAAQYGGNWINGEGIYPNDTLDCYDILKVADDMQDWRQKVLTSSGYKNISISANVPFNVSLVNYIKFSQTNR